MKIKDVEKRTGITSYNIRFYEKENLLIPKRNPVNGYREYTEEDILLLNRIKMLRMLDIPVSDIRKILYEKEALTSVLNTHLLKTINEQISNFAQTYPTNLKASSNEALLFMRRYRFANCSCFSCCFKDAYPSSNVQ